MTAADRTHTSPMSATVKTPPKPVAEAVRAAPAAEEKHCRRGGRCKDTGSTDGDNGPDRSQVECCADREKSGPQESGHHDDMGACAGWAGSLIQCAQQTSDGEAREPAHVEGRGGATDAYVVQLPHGQDGNRHC